MHDKQPAGAFWLTATVLVLFPFAAYFAAYFWLGHYVDGGSHAFRVYDQPWQATLFRPGAKVESIVRRTTVFSIDKDLPVSF